MRSDKILETYKQRFAEIFSLPAANQTEKANYLRRFLSLLNEFLYEKRPENEIEDLNSADSSHPEWRRITPLLAIWDDYAESVLGFYFDETQIQKLARVFVEMLKDVPGIHESPKILPPDEPSSVLGGMTPKQFALIRLMHALQDFSRLLPPINAELVANIRAHVEGGAIPDENVLANEDGARRLLAAFGGADANVEERIRYIFSSASILKSLECGGAYGLAEHCSGDAKKLFQQLTCFPGLKGKKANMLLRDYYELGIWKLENNLQEINIIADNRVMRVALRTGIVRSSAGKLLNSLLDEFDFQYMLTVKATEEAFRKVWLATKELNGGNYIVSYPARLDKFVFLLGDGRSGCCKPNAMSCRTGKQPPRFHEWLRDEYNYESDLACPFQEVCPEETRAMLAPFAIQNNTWMMKIFTGRGGGGGLRGI